MCGIGDGRRRYLFIFVLLNVVALLFFFLYCFKESGGGVEHGIFLLFYTIERLFCFYLVFIKYFIISLLHPGRNSESGNFFLLLLVDLLFVLLFFDCFIIFYCYVYNFQFYFCLFSLRPTADEPRLFKVFLMFFMFMLLLILYSYVIFTVIFAII